MKINNLDTALKYVNDLVDKHHKELNEFEFIVGMSRGGLFPAAHIATLLNKPLVTLYIDKSDRVYLDRVEWLRGRKILFVDDICRSGQTLDLAVNLIAEKCFPKLLKTLTIFDASPKFAVDKDIQLVDYSNKIEQDVKFPWDYDR